MYDTTLSQKYIKDMGLCKKKIKMHTQRRYATCFGMSKKREEKKMHTQRRYATCLGMSKKREKIKDSPLSKKKKKREGAYKGVHTPSTKNIHTLTHLDQGL